MVGVNATETEQVAFESSTAPLQPSTAIEKSPLSAPLTASEEMDSDDDWVFLIVTDCAEVLVSTLVVAYVSVAGEKLMGSGLALILPTLLVK